MQGNVHTHASTIQAHFSLHYADTAATGFNLDVNLTMPGTGITAIFGHSGSGKTTFLRCIAGLEKPQQGYLIVNGALWQNSATFLPTHQRPLGYVFQEASLFAHLTAKGNLAYAIKRSDKPYASELYEQVIATMDIDSILTRYPHQLSGGERQRVAIARALLIQPRILLMDEPLASLDSTRKQEILPYLERLRSTVDIPILYVSHSLDEVTRLADAIVVLDQGRVTAQGSLAEVLSRIDLPINNTEHAGVILSAKIVERDSQWQLARLAFSTGDIWVNDSGDELGQTVRVRILARDVSLALAPHSDSSILNQLSVNIAAIAADDDQSMARIQLVFGNDYIVARLTQKSVYQLQLKPGMNIWAYIKSAAIVR